MFTFTIRSYKMLLLVHDKFIIFIYFAVHQLFHSLCTLIQIYNLHMFCISSVIQHCNNKSKFNISGENIDRFIWIKKTCQIFVSYIFSLQKDWKELGCLNSWHSVSKKEVWLLTLPHNTLYVICNMAYMSVSLCMHHAEMSVISE